MIYSVRCSAPTFRDIEFTPGFNVILADRTREATKKDTRNGLGKSTLIEIIHFCLGSSFKQGKGLGCPELSGWDFSVEITLGDQRFTVERNTSSYKTVRVHGDVSNWPVAVERLSDGSYELDIVTWNKVLGYLLFGLSITMPTSYAPTFRSLISYFARRGKDAFSTPFEHFRKQTEADKQINNAFLLDLSWEDARDIQLLKAKKSLTETYRKATRSGVARSIVGSLGELEALRVRTANRASEQAANLRSFRVHNEYKEIEQRANALTAEIQDALNENLVDSRTLSTYEVSIEENHEPTAIDVNRLYREAEVSLSESIRHRLDEVQEFHKKLIENRRRFLESEINRLRMTISERKEQVQAKSDERSKLMEILEQQGALEEFTRLQNLHTATQQELREIEARIANLKQFEQTKNELKIETANLRQRATLDYDARRSQRERAINLFNESSEALYRAPGILIINVSEKGFEFAVEIQRADSSGISSMKVFCYDLMLAQLWANRNPSPRFLIHDSNLFSDVDERQIASALELAAQKSEACGFQYICMLNTDDIPWDEFSEGFNLRDYERRVLTDATDTGSLLGIRF